VDDKRPCERGKKRGHKTMTKKDKPIPGTRRTTIVEEPLDTKNSQGANHDEPQSNSPEPSSVPLDSFPGLMENLAPAEPEEIQSLLSELGDEDYKVVVYRFNKDLKKFARLDSYGHKEFTLDMLGDTYGGGKYRIYVFRPNGQITMSKIVDIDEAKKPKVDPHQVVQGQGGTHVVLPPQQDMSKIVDIMVSQNNRSQELMMTMMTKLAEVMAMSGNRPAAPSLVKDVGDIVALQKMFEPKGEPGMNSVNAVLNGLKQGLELAQMANPGGNSEGGGLMDTLLKALIPAFVGAQPSFSDRVMGAVTPVARPPIQNPIPRPQIPPTVPAPTAGLTPAQQAVSQIPAPTALPAEAEPVVSAPKESGMGLGFQLVIAMYKAPILDMAKSSFDPEKAAEIIITRIPEDYYAVCLDFTNKIDRLNYVKEFLPELFIEDPITKASCADWVTKVLDAGKEILTNYFKPVTNDTDNIIPDQTEDPASAAPEK